MVRIPARVLAVVTAAGIACCGLVHPAAAGGDMRMAVGVMAPLRGIPYQGITLPAVLPMQAIFDTVTTVDATGAATPALAVAWRTESPTAWIITLRPGVVFSNGEPFDSDAIVTSVQHMTSQQGRGETIGSTLYQIAGAEALDPMTVRIALSEPDPLFPIHIAVWRIPAPKLWKQLGSENYPANPIGSGPFVQDSRTENRLVLRANKTAWRRPKLDSLTVILAPDPVARVQALTSGAVDLAYALDPESRHAVEQVGARFERRLTQVVQFLAFLSNRDGSNVKDARVRRALNMAVNRQAIVDQLLAKSTTPTSQLAFPGAFGFDPNLKPLPYDPAAAKRLLAEAGFANGLSLKMAVGVGGALGTPVYQQVASDLAKVGVKLDVIQRPGGSFQLEMFSGHLDADMFNMFTRGNDPINDYRHRSCLGVVPDRVPFHCDPRTTDLVRQATHEQDLDKRRALYGQVAAQEQQSPPGILLWQSAEFDGLGPRVKTYTPFQDVLNLDQWDLK